MNAIDFFLDNELTPEDAAIFVSAIKTFNSAFGRDKCWCLEAIKGHPFHGFSTSHSSLLLYKGIDAKPFLLALSGRFLTDEKPVIVRRSCCESKYCLNPTHAYYGTRSDVALENAGRKNNNHSPVTGAVVAEARADHDAGKSILEISRKYKIPYHTTRRICVENTYKDFNGNFNSRYLEKLWDRITDNCNKIFNEQQNAVRSVGFAYHLMNDLECPWHHKGSSKHKGNFGLMGECLDCMEEIKNGRCTVDVTNFDINWYWTVKRFWDQVEIRGEDECWPWAGPTKKGKQESVAYFPSPFHSGKSQSASRVAFWVSRGYTGKYRVFTQLSCETFCCNPKHLTIRELKGQVKPQKIEAINLSYGNIFDQYRKSLAQNQAGSAD